MSEMVNYPKLPADLDVDMTEAQLDDLWCNLLMELAHPAWINRKHYNRRTYDAGCSGPMCRKAVREHARRRNSTNANNRYAILDAILSAWFPEANRLIQDVKHKMLTELVSKP